MEEKRLFDILKLYIAKYPSQEVALAKKESGKWKNYSIQEYVEITNNIVDGDIRFEANENSRRNNSSREFI